MPASSKKWLIVIAAAGTGAVTASSSNDNGTNRTATGMTGAFSTLTTPASVAAKMPVSSPWNTASNIETVANTAMGSTIRALAFRTSVRPMSDTLSSLTMTIGGTVFTASVIALPAFEDEGLTADAMLLGVTGLASAMQAAMA